MRIEIKQMPYIIEMEIKELTNKIPTITKENETEINIDVKHIVEDIRSTLDYIAVDIHKKYCNTHKTSKIYFQYSDAPNDEKDFINRIKKNFPGLYENHNSIYLVLAKEQWFYDNSKWLIKLQELAREVKHNGLYITFVEKEKNTLVCSDKTSMLIRGDTIVTKEGDRCSFYTPSITINGTGRAEFYCDGTVAIDDGKYDMINNKVQNLDKNTYYETVIKTKKNNEEVISLLNMIQEKLQKLVKNIESYI